MPFFIPDQFTWIVFCEVYRFIGAAAPTLVVTAGLPVSGENIVFK